MEDNSTKENALPEVKPKTDWKTFFVKTAIISASIIAFIASTIAVCEFVYKGVINNLEATIKDREKTIRSLKMSDSLNQDSLRTVSNAFRKLKERIVKSDSTDINLREQLKIDSLLDILSSQETVIAELKQRTPTNFKNSRSKKDTIISHTRDTVYRVDTVFENQSDWNELSFIFPVTEPPYRYEEINNHDEEFEDELTGFGLWFNKWNSRNETADISIKLPGQTKTEVTLNAKKGKMWVGEFKGKIYVLTLANFNYLTYKVVVSEQR